MPTHTIKPSNSYLTESKLKLFLEGVYNNNVIHNKTVPNNKLKTRPDFRIDEHNIIVEFDGYRHYSNSRRIVQDNRNDIIYKSLGYNVIRIPYFVQLDKSIIKLLFDKDLYYEQVYKHGFIDSKAMLPSDFCELGIHRFKSDLIKFSIIKDDIIKSLQAKIEEFNNIDLVLPKSLHSLVKK